jgi:hypothetical protein
VKGAQCHPFLAHWKKLSTGRSLSPTSVGTNMRR